MLRRNSSASAGVKPAATIAIFIACSWNNGTPRVRPKISSSSFDGHSTGLFLMHGVDMDTISPWIGRGSQSLPQSPDHKSSVASAGVTCFAVHGFQSGKHRWYLHDRSFHKPADHPAGYSPALDRGHNFLLQYQKLCGCR